MSEYTDLIRRLNGEYRIPIRDGLGAAGGDEPANPNEFVQHFPTTPIQKEAAAAIAHLSACVAGLEAANGDLRATALAFVAAAAGVAAKSWGLKDGELIAHHYDLIAHLGGRTAGFIRVEPPATPKEPR